MKSHGVAIKRVQAASNAVEQQGAHSLRNLPISEDEESNGTAPCLNEHTRCFLGLGAT
jgi:hypothetical protein